MHSDRVAHLIELFLIDLIEALWLRLLALARVRLLLSRVWFRHLTSELKRFVSRRGFFILRFELGSLCRFHRLSDCLSVLQGLLLFALSFLPFVAANVGPKTSHLLFACLLLYGFKVLQVIGPIIAQRNLRLVVLFRFQFSRCLGTIVVLCFVRHHFEARIR